MQLSFRELHTKDHLTLPALLFQPNKKTTRLAIWLHGMGDNAVFYKPTLINCLAEQLSKNNIAFLAFNNRGAHNKKILRIKDSADHIIAGCHYEKIIDSIKDISAAVDLAKTLDYSNLFLIGHSTGANKILTYNYHIQADNPFSKYILLAPGDDTGLFFKELTEKKFHESFLYAKKLIEKDKPNKIMPKYTGLNPFSAQSAKDILDPDGDYNTFPYYEYLHHRIGHKQLFQELKSIKIPTKVIYGENDEFTSHIQGPENAIKILKENLLPKNSFSFGIIKEANHSFNFHEKELSDTISTWLNDQ